MAQQLELCSISDDVKEKMKKFKMKKFKFSKEKNFAFAAVVLKINKNTRMVELDEEYEDLDIDELRGELPESQPRYVLLSCVLKSGDGRVSYPLCFVFVSPRGCSTELSMLYASTKPLAVNESQIPKDFEVRDLEELTEELLISKVS